MKTAYAPTGSALRTTFGALLCAGWLTCFGLAAGAQSTILTQAPAKTFYVNSTVDGKDASPGDGKCSTGLTTSSGAPQCTLRAAIDEANALSQTNGSLVYAISVPAGTYPITVSESCGTSLCVTGNVELLGASQSGVILDGGQKNTVLYISPTATALVSKVTIQNAYSQYQTAALLDEGSLTVQSVTFTKNSTPALENFGGALLTIVGCTFTYNTDGAVSFGQSAVGVSVDTSYFAYNNAYQAPAIGAFGNSNTGSNSAGPLTISNSTFVNNTATQDWIIATPSNLTMINSTVSDNTIGNTTVIGAGATVLNSDTLYNNTCGGYCDISASPLTISNTIDYPAGGLCGFTDLGHNFLGSAPYCYTPVSSTTVRGVDPQLGPVILDGGSVPVNLPSPGSPVIGAGSTAAPGGSASGACTAIDENAKPRGLKTACTVGAVEPLSGLQIVNVTPTTGGSGGDVTITLNGNAFSPDATVALHRAGQTDLAPRAAVVSATGTTISAGFDLAGAALGSYDIVVTTSTGSVTLPGGFAVQAAVAPVIQSFLAGPARVRIGRPATYTLTLINSGNNDAYLVPAYISMTNGFTGTFRNVLPPPMNSSQALTDYSNSSLGILPVPGYSAPSVNIPLLIPVIPAGGQILLELTVDAVGSEGSPFYIRQSTGTPYSTDLDTGAASSAALQAIVAGAVADDTLNLQVTPSAAAQTNMSTYASLQLNRMVSAGETALLTSFGGAPVYYSITQLLDDVGAYGAAYQPGQAAPQLSDLKLSASNPRPEWIPGLSPPPPGACDGIPIPPGSSCGEPWTLAPGVSPTNPCTSNPLLHFIASQNGDCPGGSGGSEGGNVVGSEDPNLKSGPPGVGTSHYVQANTPFPYLIEFENEANASAAAQTVSVTDAIDTSKFDLTTFQLGSISFGSQPLVLTPPAGVTSYAGSVDMRPAQNIIVYVTAALNTATGVATWNFTSLDPSTMLLTTDPTAGFLPPDTTPPVGIGHVGFTINPLGSVADASTICNTATVVFDTNSPINTAQYCNTKDVSPPMSMVQPLASTQSTTAFAVTWAGSDSGSGVGSYTIYVSDNGGAFTVWQSATTATNAQYTGVNGHTYSFYSIATDLVGNVEAAKTLGEASTTVTVVAAATLSPATVPFGAVAIGSSVSATVTVTSTGSVPLTVTGFTLSDTVNFAQTNTCSSALSMGQTCTVTVVFSPTASASVSSPTNATLSLVSNAATAPSPVTLTGTAFSLTPYIFVVNAAGSVSSLFSNGSVQSSAVSGGGIGAAVDRNGLVFSITADGTGVSTFSDSGALVNTTSGVLTGTSALAIDGGDQLWIASPGSVNVGQILGSGTATYADSTLQKPSGVAIDISGNVWISDSQSNTVHEIVGGGLPTQPLANAVTNKTPGTEPQ